jgi:hypothetical protein
VTSWLRATNSTVDATSAMQIAPTIVMIASFAPIERLANELRIFDIKLPLLSAGRRKAERNGRWFPSAKLEQNR